MDSCLFCKIVRGDIPAQRVAENDDCLAFRDIAPQAPTHVLVIPKTHYTSLNDTPDASVLGAMGEMAKEVARALGVAESGYRVVVNTGRDGGQTVHHLHLHLLAGRGLHWPPG